MKFLIKKSVTILFVYFIFCLIYLLLVSQNSEIMSKSFVILRDIGNLIGAILVINLIYSFTNNKDNESKFVQLKSIYKLILIFILLNFSKVIAGIFIDEIQIVLLTLYSSDGVVQGIIQSMH